MKSALKGGKGPYERSSEIKFTMQREATPAEIEFLDQIAHKHRVRPSWRHYMPVSGGTPIGFEFYAEGEAKAIRAFAKEAILFPDGYEL